MKACLIFAISASAIAADLQPPAGPAAPVAPAKPSAPAPVPVVFPITDPKAALARYQVVVDRNIFSRSRRPPSAPVDPNSAQARAAAEAAAAGKVDPADHLILTGITAEDGKLYAFFEAGDGKIKRVGEGDMLLDRKITRLTLDEVQAEADGKTTTITLAYTLTGKPGVRGGTATAGAGGETTHSAAPSSSSSSGGKEDSILEKLRKKREAELGGGRPPGPPSGGPGGPPPSRSDYDRSKYGGKSSKYSRGSSGSGRDGDRKDKGSREERPPSPESAPPPPKPPSSGEGGPEGAKVEIRVESKGDGGEGVLFLDVQPPPPQ